MKLYKGGNLYMIPKSRKEGEVRVIELEGRLDVHSSLEVEQYIHECIDQKENKLLIDLKNLEYLSSSGLRVFIGILRRLKGGGGTLKLAQMNESIKKIFRIVELTELFDIHPSLEEALKTFAGESALNSKE